MGNNGAFGAEGTPELILVDKILRTSYDVVKEVARNIPVIEEANQNIGEISEIVQYLPDINKTGQNITSVVTVASEITTISQLSGRIDDVTELYQNLQTVLDARDVVIVSAGNAAEAAVEAIAAMDSAVTIRDTLLDDITASVTPLAYGSPPTATYDSGTKEIEFGLPVTPATTIAVGTVDSGVTAAASLGGTQFAKLLNLTLPRGDASWTPVLSNIVDGARIVQKVTDWTGGTGTKPAINVYVSTGGYTTDISLATNIRGPTGAGTGDMNVATYDPTGKNNDAFSMANMAETSTKKILTDTERTKLAGIADGATVNATDAALRDRTTHTGAQATSTITGLDAALATKEVAANKGQINGYASLDGDGKVPVAQLPDAVLGAMQYQSGWNAATNIPAIPAADAGNKGDYYVVTISGSTSVSGITDWSVGDWIVSNGTSWEKIDNSDKVSSVNGQTGVVTLTKSSVGLSSVDNTSDASKPISSAQQAALDLKAPTSHTHGTADITGLDDAIATAQLPAGIVVYSAKTAGGVPTGFLRCNGAAISRTTYAALYAQIGTTFGSGDGSTTFNVPELRGEFIRGWDNGRGVDSSRTFGSAQGDQMESHTHSVDPPSTTTSSDSHNHTVSMGIKTGTSLDYYLVSMSGGPIAPVTGTYTTTTDAHTHTLNIAAFNSAAAGGTTNSSENRPRNVALLAIIKY